MAEKLEILHELGESALPLPEQVNRALAANDAIKYLMTVLQAAVQHADLPDVPAPDLSIERIAAGVAHSALDRVTRESRRTPDGYRIPEAPRIYAEMRACLESMVTPIRTAAGGNGAFDAGAFESRIPAVAPEALIASEEVPARWVAEATRADRGAGDSVHLLVMDLHRELNRLQATITQETLDGAAVYGVQEEDRPRILAFMAGLNRTAPLKFDHPGLAATATRVGEALVIQDDIGTTDAHVLVVRVHGLGVTVTYTDVHPERAAFFRSLFDTFGAQWTQAGRVPGWESEEASYVLLTGQYAARDETDLRAFLTFLGSRIVFLIDWNRARRALRKFVRNRDAVEVLRWGANEEIGHRALIQLGGDALIAEAVDLAAPQPLPYGQRLDQVLGRDTTMEYLRTVLRVTATNLRAGRSERLIRDEVRSELTRRFRSLAEHLIGLAAEHSLVVIDLADVARAGMADALAGGDEAYLAALARRARQWEVDGDALVVAARRAEAQSLQEPFYGRLLSMQDDAADALEDIAFFATLLPSVEPPAALRPTLVAASDLLVRGARALVKCIAAAAAMEAEGGYEDTRDFLEAVDEVVTIEHQADDVGRELIALVVRNAESPRQQHLLDALGASIEQTLDAMSHTALALHDHLMERSRVRRP